MSTTFTDGLTANQIEYLQQSGILEAFHYGLSHLAASGVYMNHVFEKNSLFAAQQLHTDDTNPGQPGQQEDPKSGGVLSPGSKKLPQLGGSASTPVLPSINTKAGLVGSTINVVPPRPTGGIVKVDNRDAYEIMASHIERFSTSWDMDARTSELLATLPSSSTAHPKRRPHVSNHINEYIKNQKELSSKQAKKQAEAVAAAAANGMNGAAAAHSASDSTGSTEPKLFLTEEKDGEENVDDAAAKPWSPEMQIRQKRDTKAYLASPARVFSKSPTRDEHGRMTGLYDGSAAYYDEAVAEGPDSQSQPLHLRSPPKKTKPIVAAMDRKEIQALHREAQRRLSPTKSKFIGGQATAYANLTSSPGTKPPPTKKALAAAKEAQAAQEKQDQEEALEAALEAEAAAETAAAVEAEIEAAAKAEALAAVHVEATKKLTAAPVAATTSSHLPPTHTPSKSTPLASTTATATPVSATPASKTPAVVATPTVARTPVAGTPTVARTPVAGTPVVARTPVTGTPVAGTPATRTPRDVAATAAAPVTDELAPVTHSSPVPALSFKSVTAPTDANAGPSKPSPAPVTKPVAPAVATKPGPLGAAAGAASTGKPNTTTTKPAPTTATTAATPLQPKPVSQTAGKPVTTTAAAVDPNSTTAPKPATATATTTPAPKPAPKPTTTAVPKPATTTTAPADPNAPTAVAPVAKTTAPKPVAASQPAPTKAAPTTGTATPATNPATTTAPVKTPVATAVKPAPKPVAVAPPTTTDS